ncbi:MAG: DUF3368 domain-containing protein, partial [Campylobacterota bacterium]|nr:DUF3368 domain-containing protein [Campylobacterota bacterium]
MILIADSSALIALSIVDKLDILEKLFGEVYIPKAVYGEISQENKTESHRLSLYCRDRILDISSDINFNISLGLGESEAMVLYKEKNADFLLCDDKKAKKFARNFGMTVIGSLGVLLKAKEAKLIAEVAPLIEILKSSEIFIDDKTYE